MTPRTLNIVTWSLTILFALWIFVAGLSHVVPSYEQIDNFRKWDLSRSFMVFIGICEMLGAIALFFPKLRSFAVLGLTVILVGAIATHITSEELVKTPSPTIALLMLLSVFFLWRKKRRLSAMP